MEQTCSLLLTYLFQLVNNCVITVLNLRLESIIVTYNVTKRSVLRRQSRDTNRNIKRSVFIHNIVHATFSSKL